MPDHTARVASDDSPGETLAWHVGGMDCASCAAKVRTAVERLAGVSAVEVNLMAERLTLCRSPGGVPPAAVERQISALGYRPTRMATQATEMSQGDGLGNHHTGHHDGSGHAGRMHMHSSADEAMERVGVAWWRSSKAWLVVVLGALVALAWVTSQVLPHQAHWIYVAATLAGLLPFGRRALALGLAGTPFSIETLMCTAALGAVLIGAVQEAAVVVLLFAMGELLEGVAAGQARAGIRSLASLLPRMARREGEAGGMEEVEAATLRIGDVVQVRPGDRLPCDGEIVEGRSALDESPVTGESVPVA